MDERNLQNLQDEKPSHISYKEYQKKVSGRQNDGIAIFVSAFFILLLLFLGIAKQLSPDVDVSIGDNETVTSDSSGIEKNEIDERLKLLQMEDEGKNDLFADELEEKVVLPKDKQEDEVVADKIKEELPEKVMKVEKEATPKPEETSSPAPKVTTVQQPEYSNISSKVVVGYYATKEQAEVAKGIIAESGLNISPFVRAIGGAYTIQVGSYSSREKAQSVVNDLLRNNYPARIITE